VNWSQGQCELKLLVSCEHKDSALVVALIRNIDIIVAFISWSRDGPNENEQVGAFAEQSFRNDWI
jgi:hypothetical protein